MKLNEKVLALLGSQWNDRRITKTGLLWMSEGKPVPKRHRWFVLKGNMLFYFRDPKGQDLIGCIVVEKLALKIIDDRTFEFKLEFDANIQQDYFFMAEAKADFDHWHDLLKTCSYEYNSALKVLLQHRSRGVSFPTCLRSFNDGTYAQRRAVLDYRANLSDLPTPSSYRSGKNVSLRILLSAEKLTGPSFVVSNVYIQVQVKYLTWFNYHRTEVKRSVNPVFDEAAVFNFDASLLTKMNATRIRLVVYHDSGTAGVTPDGTGGGHLPGFSPFGVAECRIQDVTQARSDDADGSALELPLRDTNDLTEKSAGVVKLQVKDLVPTDLLRNSNAANRKGNVARLGAKIEGPIFRFATVDNGEVRAREVMGESAYFQIVPSKLLAIYTKEDTEAIRELQQLDNILSREAWDEIVRPVFDYLLQRQALYHQHTAVLDGHEGSTFRPSVQKKSSSLEMTAVNCHIQRLEVLNKDDQVEAMYDTITHGAMAAHALKFKNGGLRRILKENTDSKWLAYRNVSMGYKEHLKNINDIIDTSALKLLASFEEMIKQSVEDPQSTNHFACIVNNEAKPFTSEDCRAIRQAISSDLPVVSLMSDKAEIRFSDNVASPTGLPHMVYVNLETNESYDVREIKEDRKISKQDRSEIEKLIGITNFFITFLKGESQHAIIDEALQDTLDLRMQRPQTWLSSGGLTTSPGGEESANPFVGEQAESESHSQRRLASISAMMDQPRSRIQLQAEVSMCLESLKNTKSTQFVEMISHLHHLRRTVKTAIADIQNALLIKELQKRSACLDEIEHRRDVAFSQACTILVTAFVSSLRLHSKNPIFLKQIAKIGYLAQFESLLSTHGNEMGMIEDMAQAILDCKEVTFKLTRATIDANAYQTVNVSGRRYKMCFEIAIHKSYFDRLPDELKNGDSIEVVPVFFSHGVNEFQTIANKIGETQLQDEIVERGYSDLVNYATLFKQQICTLMPNPNVTRSEIDSHVVYLDKSIRLKKAKNVEILVAAQKLVRKLKGGRLTCCKSGKDRTGMSVTLEQCNLLIDYHRMQHGNLQNALDVMRSIGTRIDNVEKNTGERKYAFNKLQIYTLPRLLRPPLMSIGSQVT